MIANSNGSASVSAGISPTLQAKTVKTKTAAVSRRSQRGIAGMTDTPTFFTVLTPTYNRAGTLHRVYESLSRQTFRDFEWVVVDDGSTDNTHDSCLLYTSDAADE